MQPINFEPLKNISHYRFPPYTVYLLTGLFIIIALLGMVFPDLLFLIFLLTAAVLIPIFLQEYHKYNKQKQAALAKFASLNNFTFAPGAIPPATKPGSLFSHGHSKKIADQINGHLANYPFSFYKYQYTTGYGKSSSTHQATLMEIDFPKNLPHIIIDSQLEQGGSVLPIEFDTNQRLHLEGDFDTYFHVYSPQNYHISALSILTPDVMQTLLNIKHFCDIEIIDNKLYLYWSGNPASPAEYEEIFSTAQKVLHEIGSKLTRGDIFADPGQAILHSEPSIMGGVRLRKSYKSVWLVVGFVIFYLAPTLFPNSYFSIAFNLGFFILLLILAVGLLHKSYRAARLRSNLLKRH